jgi:uncharacterized membrane protein YfcA
VEQKEGRVSPTLVLILGLLACVAGGSVAAQADNLPEKLGAMIPGWTLIVVALIMSARRSRAKRADRENARQDIGDVDES